MSAELKKLADNAASVLRDDPELVLDIARELEEHLEDKTEALMAGGKTKDDAEAEAIKAFGPLEEVAEALISANRRRMSLRGRARMIARFVVVPLAVMLAALMWIDMNGLNGLQLYFPFSSLPNNELKVSDELNFLIHGDTSRDKKSAQIRAIWERTPTNKAYFGNYITYLTSEVTDENFDLAFFEKEIRLGEKIDPDNSRYAMDLGTVLVNASIAWQKNTDDSEQEDQLIVNDRTLLERGIKELLRVPTLSTRYNRGAGETMQEKLDLLSPKSFAEQVHALNMVAGQLLPQLSHYRTFVLVLPHYARILSEEGRRDDAARALELWEPFTIRLMNGSHTLIEILVARTLINIADTGIVPVCKELGLKDLADRMKNSIDRYLSVFPVESTEFSELLSANIQHRGGILADMLVPALSGVGSPEFLADLMNPEACAVSRWLEYIVCERLVLCFLIPVVLAFLMIQTYVVGVAGRIFSKARALLLLPPLSESLKILGFGILLPITLYMVYSRLLPWSGREANLSLRFGLEMLVLIAYLVCAPTLLAGRWYTCRCRDLNIPMWRWSGLATTCRSLVPVFAASLILLALLCGPYLRHAERELVSNKNNLLRVDGFGFTLLEDKVVEKIRDDFVKLTSE